MQELHIKFQQNSHPRDLVYELSAAYLLARAVQIAAELNLGELILPTGTNFAVIRDHYPDLNVNALNVLIEVLVAYGVYARDRDNILIATPISCALHSQLPYLRVLAEQWLSSYDVLPMLAEVPHEIEILINNHSLTYKTKSAIAVVQEMARLHLLARAIRFATGNGIFEYYAQQSLPAKVATNHHDLIPLFRLLSRYHLMRYQEDEQLLDFTFYTHYLLKSHPESLYYAMLMIDQRWWKATAYLKEGLRKNTNSAYEIANHCKFYETDIAFTANFARGMASISLLEDREVAAGCHTLLTDYRVIIDIGGGEGGLLNHFYKYFDSNKSYILYDKKPPTTQDDPSNAPTMFTIMTGDFLLGREENNIPHYTHAAYVIKCVLHNMQRSDAIKVLRNVRLAMGNHCQLFLAERVVPYNQQLPHPNLTCNLLMQLLFKADAHDCQFYEEVLDSAGFNLNKTVVAGNYMVFNATEKPELSFQKSSSHLLPLTTRSPHLLSDSLTASATLNSKSPRP